MEGHCRCSRCLVVYYVRVDRLLSAAVASEININRQSQVVHTDAVHPRGLGKSWYDSIVPAQKLLTLNLF